VPSQLEHELIKGFKDFVLRGNIIELAVALVIGTAFTAVVKSFTEAIIGPLIAAFGGSGGIGFGFRILSGNPGTYVNIGAVLTAVITFVITAAVVYFALVVPMNAVNARLARGKEPALVAPTDLQLLAEIRDLLKAQNSGTRI